MKSLSHRQIVPTPIAFLLMLAATPYLSRAQQIEAEVQVTFQLISILDSQ